jgi:hypothetical protein
MQSICIQTRSVCVSVTEVRPEQPSEYEQLLALASRVDQLLRELETWLHVRERVAAKGGARAAEQAWRRRRLAIARHSRALLAALLRGVEL